MGVSTLTFRRHKGGASVRVIGLLTLMPVLLATVWTSLAVGSGPVGIDGILPGVFDPDLADKGRLILREVRIPRTAAGPMAGVALGLAGAVMQGVARNRPADPGPLGINAGEADGPGRPVEVVAPLQGPPVALGMRDVLESGAAVGGLPGGAGGAARRVPAGVPERFVRIRGAREGRGAEEPQGRSD